MLKKAVTVLFLGSALAFTTVACGGTSDAVKYCEAVAECAGTSIDACSADSDSDAEVKCESEGNAYVSCALNNSTCEEKVYTLNEGACESQLEAFSKCFAAE